MKLFVTGGAGFIGSNFIRLALSLDKGHTVVNFDKLTYAGNLSNLNNVTGNPNYKFTKGDICDAVATESAMAGCDAVVHFAAESHVDRSIVSACRRHSNERHRHLRPPASRSQIANRAFRPHLERRSVRRYPAGFFLGRKLSPHPQQSLFRFESCRRPRGSLFRANLQLSCAHHALF